jgi:ribonuclease Z
MRIITLGTGAGRPTLNRSSSAVALEHVGRTFLFDCGEGTQVQLMKSPLHWGKLQAIFIGHLHGDHVNGLPGLLGTLSLSDRQEALTVYGPKGLQEFLAVHQKFQSMNLRYPLKVCEINQSGLLHRGEDFQVETFPLTHSIPCWGYVFREDQLRGHFDGEKADREGIPSGPLRAQLIEGKTITVGGKKFHPDQFLGPPRPGRSVAYCLDTKPCEEAVKLAQGVDLLLYEATFGCEYETEAHDWGHSTAADGARIARQAGVKRLILTHISQRYSDPTVLLEEARAIFPEVRVASDLEIFYLDGNP